MRYNGYRGIYIDQCDKVIRADICSSVNVSGFSVELFLLVHY